MSSTSKPHSLSEASGRNDRDTKWSLENLPCCLQEAGGTGWMSLLLCFCQGLVALSQRRDSAHKYMVLPFWDGERVPAPSQQPFAWCRTWAFGVKLHIPVLPVLVLTFTSVQEQFSISLWRESECAVSGLGSGCCRNNIFPP